MVYELLGSSLSDTCMGLTVSNISKVLRTEVGARQPICIGYAQVPDGPMAGTRRGQIQIAVPWL